MNKRTKIALGAVIGYFGYQMYQKYKKAGPTQLPASSSDPYSSGAGYDGGGSTMIAGMSGMGSKGSCGGCGSSSGMN